MIQSEFTDISIMGVMTAVPGNTEVIENKYNSLFGEQAVRQFSKTTGVVERHVTGEYQTASDLAYVASRELLKEKNIEKKEIGVLVFVTQMPDYRIPATACVLHKRLGLSKECMAFDVNMGCSGYVYGMQIICSLMSCMDVKYGLLLVGDTSIKSISPEDKSAIMLFGEAGSATLLGKKDDNPYIKTVYRTDGEGFKTIITPAGAYRNMDLINERTMWGDGNKRSDYDLYMNGVDVFSFSITEVPDMINEFLKKEEEKDGYDSFIFHQANCYILKQIIKKCKLPKDRVPISMDRYGNTSVASIPLTICDRYGLEGGERQVRMFTCGFGVGLSWGITDFAMNIADIYPIIETDEYYTEGRVSHD